MIQKIITVILALGVVGALVWYVNKNYIEPSSGTSVKVIGNNNTDTKKTSTAENVSYAVIGAATEIWSTDASGEKKKIFTDADETEKIQSLSNNAESNTLAITSTGAKVGTLVLIDLSTAKEQKVRTNFAVPENLILSADGTQFAYTRFSNVEEEYGFTLYTEKVSSGTPEKAFNSQSEIIAPAFSPSGSKIAYAVINGANTDLYTYSFGTAASTKLITFSGEVVDWISWNDINKIVVSKRKTNKSSSGEIDSVDPNSGTTSKLAEFSGGRANFAYLNSDGRLAFMVAQYDNKVDPKTQGQVYIVDLNNKSKATLEKANQILGWL